MQARRGGGGGWGSEGFGKILAMPLTATPKKHTFKFRIRVHERVATSLAEVYERVGKSVISACKRTSKG